MRKKIFIDGIETNYSVDTEGNVYNDKTGKIMKGTYARNEYHTVQLSIEGGLKTVMVHRLVAQAFLDKPEGKDIVDHIDRNKRNNHVDNLRWVTAEENNLNKGRTKTADALSERKKIPEEYSNFEWKTIPGKEEYMACKEGYIKNKSNKVLLGSERNGYYRVNLVKYGHISVHRLIWETFNGPIPDDKVIDHIDGNRHNNNLSNLRCVSQSENMYNSQMNGHSGQVKVKQYDEMGNFIAEYTSLHNAAVAINGSEYAIKSAAERHGKSAGYFWIREDQNITIEDILKNYKPRKTTYDKIYQYDKDKNFLNEFSSKRDAARAVDCAESTITRALDQDRLSKGYYWTSKKIDSENSLTAGQP